MREARVSIEQLVRDFDLEEHKFPPFDSLSELATAMNESGVEFEAQESDDHSESLSIALVCLDVFHSYLCNCAFASFSRLIVRKDQSPKTKASFTLLSGVASDVGAIKSLCREGYDIQAKSILRSMREKVDYLIAAQMDRSFAVGYVDAANSDSNNAFWHRRVARGKLKKHIAQRLERHSRDGRKVWDKEWSKRRETLERWLGEAVHPSHTTGLLSAFPEFGGDDEVAASPGWFGQPSDLSLPTIRAVMSIAIEVTLLVKLRGLATSEDFAAVSHFDNGEEDLFILHSSLENFLNKCFANSLFAPNLDIFKILSYLDGYVLRPIESDFDVKEYEAEVLGILISLMEKAKGKLDGKIVGSERS